MSVDIVGVGCVAVDDVLYAPEYPPPDSKIRINRKVRRLGGLTATALVAASRLGAHCAYANALGTDELSEFVVHSLQAEHVDTQAVARREHAAPSHSVIIVDESTGSRTIFSDPAAHPPIDSFQFDPSLIRSARVLLVDHTAPVRQLTAARTARDAGVAVVGDFERMDAPAGQELFSLVDHLIVPLAFALHVTGVADPAQAAAQLLTAQCSVVAVTAGRRGAWVAARDSMAFHVPAFAVSAVDTVGCGDVFHGAYAAALVQGRSIQDRVKLASAAAALKATGPGLDRLTGLSAVLHLMNSCDRVA